MGPQRPGPLWLACKRTFGPEMKMHLGFLVSSFLAPRAARLGPHTQARQFHFEVETMEVARRARSAAVVFRKVESIVCYKGRVRRPYRDEQEKRDGGGRTLRRGDGEWKETRLISVTLLTGTCFTRLVSFRKTASPRTAT